MKTVAKISMTALATVLCVLVAASSSARAQQVTASPAPVPAPATVAPGPSSTEVSSSVKEALDSISVPGASASVSKSKDKGSAEAKKEDGATMPGLPGKVPGSVKEVVKKLNTDSDSVTLENLNEAREAVVKLDVLIDIEKRLNDLAKLRRAREEDESSVADAIPASALGLSAATQAPVLPPPITAPALPVATMAPTPVAPVHSSSPQISDLEVMQITGASGRFAAQIKEAGGSTRIVHVGDKLSDGSKVSAISISGVSVTTGSKSRKTFAIKDAPAIFVSQE